jgi:multidrug resistance efflux pump
MRDGLWTHVFCVLFVGSSLCSRGFGADDPAPGRVVLETKGYVVPHRQITVSSRVSGQIIEMLIKEGQRVKQGEVLARLDPGEYNLALGLARAELKVAEIRRDKVKDEPGLALAMAQAEVEVARARVALAEYRVEGTTIRAPAAGVILAKRAELGTLLNPTGFNVSATLCDLAELEPALIEVWVQERDLERTALGQPCTARLDAYPRTTYRGKVAHMAPVADRSRGALRLFIQLEVPAGDQRLLPELSAIVQFLAK